MRIFLAFRCFFSLLFSGRLPNEARVFLPALSAPEVVAAPVAVAPAPAPNHAAAVQLLGLLQREGRLLDFLAEDIDGYQDAQIGAAVRDIHRGCKKVLAEHLPLEPIMKEAENARVRVDAGFDPARIRLVGNVIGEPPFSGTLRHHGWKVRVITMPSSNNTGDSLVVTPAEVEL